MRVLSALGDPGMGGPQIRSLMIARKLREFDIQTEFLIPDGDDAFMKKAKNSGFKIHQPGIKKVQKMTDINRNLKYLLKFNSSVEIVRNVIERRDIDITHINMPYNLESAVGAWKSSSPFVWHFNDVHMPFPIKNISSILAKNLADCIAASSEAVKNYYFPSVTKDINMLYPPVNVCKFDPSDIEETYTKEFDICERTTVIGTVGNIAPIKGHRYLIRAISILNSKIERKLFVPIIGSVPNSRVNYYNNLNKLINDRDLDSTIEFLGYRPDIAPLLSDMDVFVFPSVAEACPIAVLEAMAMEKPIVATNVGGIPEQISDGKSGWLVPPENPGILAKSLFEAVHNRKEATRRAKSARKKAMRKFSLERCTDRHLSVYKKLSD